MGKPCLHQYFAQHHYPFRYVCSDSCHVVRDTARYGIRWWQHAGLAYSFPVYTRHCDGLKIKNVNCRRKGLHCLLSTVPDNSTRLCLTETVQNKSVMTAARNQTILLQISQIQQEVLGVILHHLAKCLINRKNRMRHLIHMITKTF